MAKILERKQQLHDLLWELLPAPLYCEATKGAPLLCGGDPGLVAAQVTERGLKVFVYGVRWDGPFTPVSDHRKLCQLAWKELPQELPALTIAVRGLVEAAIAVRQAQFIVCQYCCQATPPEWRHAARTCQSCAEKYLGVVH